MLVTGGHSFDTTEFFQTFNQLEGLRIKEVMQPEANIMIANGDVLDFDAIVFYDMWREIDSAAINGYLEMTDQGVGLVFLHHSLVSYQDWDEFIKIIGGKYHQPGEGSDSSQHSGYAHDLDLKVSVLPDHPVTKDMVDFTIHDEGYSNIEVLPEVEILLQTNHELSAPQMGWTHQYRNSKVVYLMLGHDKKAYENPAFQKLVRNSIFYVSGSD
jgi:type 1 glutamine amidotransferase